MTERNARTRATARQTQKLVLSELPVEEDQLGAETGAHSGEDAVAAGLARGVFEVALEDGEDGGGGEVADFAEALP